MNKKNIILNTLLFFLCFSISITNAQEVEQPQTIDLKKVQKLIDSGKSFEAYNLLSKFLDVNAGQLDFDYLYGLAASDQKNFAFAIMAFQRVLSLEPNFVGARLEMAKAHFELDELLIAKNEFLEVRSKNPPENINKIIQFYLNRIDGIQKDANEKPWSISVGMVAGTDDNVNSATDATSYLGFDLSTESIKTESTFTEFSVAGTYNYKLSKRNSMFLAANYNTRLNTDASFADTSANTITLGLQHLLTKAVLNYGFIINNNALDGDSNTSLNGITASIYDENNDGNNNVIHFRYANIDNKINDIQDIDQIIGGLSKSYNLKGGNSVALSFIFGADSPKQADSPYGKIILGGRVGGVLKTSSKLTIGANAGYIYSPYSGQFNGEDRSDSLISFGLNSNYQFNKKITLSAIYNNIDNQSNIDLYTYTRSYFFAKINWSY